MDLLVSGSRSGIAEDTSRWDITLCYGRIVLGVVLAASGSRSLPQLLHDAGQYSASGTAS